MMRGKYSKYTLNRLKKDRSKKLFIFMTGHGYFFTNSEEIIILRLGKDRPSFKIISDLSLTSSSIQRPMNRSYYWLIPALPVLHTRLSKPKTLLVWLHPRMTKNLYHMGGMTPWMLPNRMTFLTIWRNILKRTHCTLEIQLWIRCISIWTRLNFRSNPKLLVLRSLLLWLWTHSCESRSK